MAIQWKTAAIKVREKALYGLRQKDRQNILLSEKQDAGIYVILCVKGEEKIMCTSLHMHKNSMERLLRN